MNIFYSLIVRASEYDTAPGVKRVKFDWSSSLGFKILAHFQMRWLLFHWPIFSWPHVFLWSILRWHIFFIIMLILRLILIHIVPYLILKLLNNLFSANDFLGSMLNCIYNKFILTNYIIKSWVNYNRKFKTQICLFAITLCWCNYDMNFLVNIKTTPFFQ